MELSKNFGDIVEVVLQERDCEKSSMWKCPKCGREFKKKEQSHYCGEKPKTINEYILSRDTDKGTIRIPYGKIDAALIEKIAKWCMETGNHA